MTLDKSITRDSTNTITVTTPYLELNTKSEKIVNDMVTHVEGQIATVEAFMNVINDGVLGHVAVAKNYADSALIRRDEALAGRDVVLQTKTEVVAAIANAGMDYPAVSKKLKAQFFGVL